jgi:hypothetical protein
VSRGSRSVPETVGFVKARQPRPVLLLVVQFDHLADIRHERYFDAARGLAFAAVARSAAGQAGR